MLEEDYWWLFSSSSEIEIDQKEQIRDKQQLRDYETAPQQTQPKKNILLTAC